MGKHVGGNIVLLGYFLQQRKGSCLENQLLPGDINYVQVLNFTQQ